MGMSVWEGKHLRRAPKPGGRERAAPAPPHSCPDETLVCFTRGPLERVCMAGVAVGKGALPVLRF